MGGDERGGEAASSSTARAPRQPARPHLGKYPLSPQPVPVPTPAAGRGAGRVPPAALPGGREGGACVRGAGSGAAQPATAARPGSAARRRGALGGTRRQLPALRRGARLPALGPPLRPTPVAGVRRQPGGHRRSERGRVGFVPRVVGVVYLLRSRFSASRGWLQREGRVSRRQR